MNRLLFLLTSICLLAIGCEEVEQPPQQDEKYTISGAIQKGPFVMGTNAAIQPLDEHLDPIYQQHITQISDNGGSYTFNNVDPIQYAEITTTGNYFNEVTGEVSDGRIKLCSIVEVNNGDTSNVNILTSLIFNRVKTLTHNGNITVGNAIAQAERELFSNLGIAEQDVPGVRCSKMDISQAGDSNALLLAISVVLQYERSAEELSGLITNLATDLANDGNIEKHNIAELYIQEPNESFVADVTKNLGDYYAQHGIESEVPDFGKYLKYFIKNESSEQKDIPVLSISDATITLGESVTFTVRDADNNDITSLAYVYNAKDITIVENPYTPQQAGSYTFYATYNDVKSDTVSLTVEKPASDNPAEFPADPQPENYRFNHRVVIIDHTGVNCGYCPEITDLLIVMQSDPMHKCYNEVTCHAGAFAKNDPASSHAANCLNSIQMPDGYPDVRCNLYGGKMGNHSTSSFKRLLEQNVFVNGADVGIALMVEGDENEIVCTAQVKSNETQEYMAVAWLLENSIYSPNQSGASKPAHYIYNHALRNISGTYSDSNVLGESVGVIAQYSTYDCTFHLPITDASWKWENMGVLVIISAKDAQGRWDVANSAYCKIGESKTFEYIE